MLGKDMIEMPSQWQLVLEASASELSVVAFSGYEEHALISHTIQLDSSAPTPLRALEDAVYDNPMLLLDFRRTIIIFDTPQFMPLPLAAADDADVAEALFRKAFPAGTSATDTVIRMNRLDDLNAVIAFEIPDDTLGFLQRTFQNAPIIHPLAPVASYFRAKHPTRRTGKTLVNLRRNRMDMIILGENAPLVMNSFRIAEPMDAVYYILSARAAAGLRDTDEIMIAGDRIIRSSVTPVLRRYVRYVMPAIFPSVMFRAGRASLSAPFEMIVAPLTTR